MFSTSTTTILLNTFKSIRPISYYITTPIFYVNSSPHIGHVHTLLVADALNRYNRFKLNRHDTVLSTGTDEHGIKVQTAAESSNLDYQELCDSNSKKFTDVFDQYDTTLTDFIRTSEERHKKCVRAVWKELCDRGFIYKSEYSGWYCSSNETFVPDSQVTKKELNGSVVHVDQNENPVVWSSEENYMFRLSKVKDKIHDWLFTEKPLIPEKFNSEALSMLEHHALDDISISRPKKRLKWGIEVPGDSDQTIYVWLDALTNYLTTAGYPWQSNEFRRWPIDCQVIGKDIIKFHALYWPAFLTALSLPLPRKLICHSHWLVDSKKMSKSLGNVVDPLEENQLLTPEGLRYYLLRSGTPHSDTDYNQLQAFRCVNSELAGTYGNLLTRCTMPAINPQQTITTKLSTPAKGQISEIIDHLEQLSSLCDKHYESANFYRGVDHIMAVLRLNNKLYQHVEPWRLVRQGSLLHKNSRSFDRYTNLQTITFETLRICSILLQPIVPKLSSQGLDRLNVTGRSWNDASVLIEVGDPSVNQRNINTKVNPILFPRLKYDNTISSNKLVS